MLATVFPEKSLLSGAGNRVKLVVFCSQLAKSEALFRFILFLMLGAMQVLLLFARRYRTKLPFVLGSESLDHFNAGNEGVVLLVVHAFEVFDVG